MSSSDIDYLEYFDYVSGYGDDYYQNSINEQGAGTGKIAAQFAYETPCQRAIGDPNSFKIEYIKGDILNFP
eukprot:gene41458-54955_t